MARVRIPSLMRDLTGGESAVDAPGETVAQVIEALDRIHPGVKERLMAKGDLDPAIMVIVDGRAAPRGLWTRVDEESEVRFLPAIGGG